MRTETERCACGSLLFICKYCGDDRCLKCDPYDHYDEPCRVTPTKETK